MVPTVHWYTIVWTDLRIATTLHQDPLLPYCPQEYDLEQQVPQQMPRCAVMLAGKTMSLMPFDMYREDTLDLLYRLHLGCITFTQGDGVAVLERKTFWAVQELAYKGMYPMCRLLARGEKRPFSTSHAIFLSMRMFAWTCVPKYTPGQVRIKVCHTPLMKRVSEKALDSLYKGMRVQKNLVCWWKREARLECLLWLLFVAWGLASTECFGHQGKFMPEFHATEWFLTNLSKVVLALDLQSKDKLEEELRRFPWVDHFNGANLDRFWQQHIMEEGVTEMNSEASITPMVSWLETDQLLSGR